MSGGLSPAGGPAGQEPLERTWLWQACVLFMGFAVLCCVLREELGDCGFLRELERAVPRVRPDGEDGKRPRPTPQGVTKTEQ